MRIQIRRWINFTRNYFTWQYKFSKERIRLWIVAARGKIKRYATYLSIAIVTIVIVFLLLWLPIKFGEYQTTTVDLTKNDTTVETQYRTGWDILGLLIIPVVLAVGAYLFNKATSDSDQRIATDRQNEASLQAYLDKMTELLLDKNHHKLRTSDDDVVGIVAQARTVTTLRTLDGNRKGQLIHFLFEANLIKNGKVLDLSSANLKKANLSKNKLSGANLSGADLSGADLSGADLSRKAILKEAILKEPKLSGADLSGANLSGANLSRADLSLAILHEANLSDADLRGANLSRADLSLAILHEANLSEAIHVEVSLLKALLNAADLSGADLSNKSNLYEAILSGAHLDKANLRGANLSGAHLDKADLRGANLSGADLSGADLSGADLSGANLKVATVSKEQLLKTKSRKGATMPDGTKHE